jgi:hypothetical protein
MPRVIIKVHQDQNLYVEWSSIAEGPCTWGNRTEMIANGVTPQRLDRADLNGASSLSDGQGSGPWWWGDDDFIYQQEGIVTRTKLPELLYRLGNNNRDVADLLEPFPFP